jgi:hypothetical protein
MSICMNINLTIILYIIHKTILKPMSVLQYKIYDITENYVNINTPK